MKRRVKGARREKFFSELTKLLFADPDAKFSQLPPKLNISPSAFYRWREDILRALKRQKKEGHGQINKTENQYYIDYIPIDDYIKAHPGSSFSEFFARTKIPISDASYYTRRKLLNGGVSKDKTIRKVKKTRLAPNTKKLLKRLIRKEVLKVLRVLTRSLKEKC